MDSKGIVIPGSIQVPNNEIRHEKKVLPPIRPILDSKRTDMEGMPETKERKGDTVTLTRQDTERAAQILKQDLENVPGIEVDWKFNRDAGVLVVQVKDQETGRVLREIPPEQILKILGGSFNQGLLLDKKA